MTAGTIFLQMFNNKIFIATLVSWIIAQAIKVFIGVIRQKRFDFRWFLGTGGMPSSHAAGASCLAFASGLEYGFDSIYFALAASFAIVVMFDAQGVRRATGKQARILNKIMEDIYWQGKIEEGRLRELVGHTPIEVIGGFLLGALVAFIAR
ncbi:MAG: divergent PAP2 family protein [Candidatus Omnitrophota bacterium]|nr:divergent PAP2 family protein [Candidatus Omnitrophota bacterium]MBU1928656.1 divergent PAP2 family protein [Candidatus Omnitrophota bacterium]MBU2035779.1 divergent PAP2 family protein [Candidatus Omnitrophota bacterium]MBU2258331.1 divergent PAP2 family protein [Candidatus Omnitrophota bacterium]